MIESSDHLCCAGAASKRWVHLQLHRFCGLLALVLLLGAWPARADGPDDEYLQIYGLIQQADELNTSGKTVPAKAKYQEARVALKSFQTNYPYWNVKLVSYRLNYVAQKVAAPAEKPSPVAGDPTDTSTTQVKLLEAGAEPRTALRLHPKAGDKQTLNLTTKMAMETKMGEAQVPAMKLPEMTMTMDVTVKDVAVNGDISYELVMGDTSVADEPGAMPQIADAMKTALAGIKGLSAACTVSSRGVSKTTEFKVPAGADPQARQMVDLMKDSFTQVVAPLPDEPVGPGAKWEVKLPIKSQGISIDQTTTSELVSIEGDRLTTKGTMTQRASNQKIENPAMPGMKLDLTKMTGNGTFEATRDLGKLLPTAGTSVLRTETSASFDMGGQKQAINMKMDLNVRLEAK